MKRALGALVLVACGSSPPAEHTMVANAPVAADAAVVAVELDAGPASPDDTALEALRAEVEPAEARDVLPTLAHALDDCRPGGEECSVPMTAIWDGGTWVVLDVDASEGGSESFVLLTARPDGETELARGTFDRAGRARLTQASHRWRSVTPPTDRIGTSARQEFSISGLVALVSLTPPLEGELWLHTSTDLDHPEHTLTWIRPDGSRVELGRRAASLGPCDGDGMTCAATGWEDCTMEQMRAENRLCVLPVGMNSVLLAPDGASIAILGTVAVAGDGGYPPFHWVVAWPSFGGP